MTFITNSRRDFLKNITATSVFSATAIPVFTHSMGIIENEPSGAGAAAGLQTGAGNEKYGFYDGPSSPLFKEIIITGNHLPSSIKGSVSQKMAGAIEHMPAGQGTAWGVPFRIPEEIILIRDQSFSLQVAPFSANWLVFLHTSDSIKTEPDKIRSGTDEFKGAGQLNEHVADYFIVYTDGTEEKAEIRERHQIGMFQQMWGENNVLSVAAHKPMPQRAHHEQMTWGWGGSQTRVNAMDRGQWINWLWAWENPHPEKQVAGFRFVPIGKAALVISAVSSGMASSNPFRWQERQKAILSLGGAGKFDPTLSENG